MEEVQEWEEGEMAVDSGATETVINEDTLPGIPVREGEAKNYASISFDQKAWLSSNLARHYLSDLIY